MLPREWLYVIPDNNMHILYAPLHKTAFELTKRAANNIRTILDGNLPTTAIQSEIYNLLNSLNLLNPPEASRNTKSHKIFLSVTNKCNLRCIYCYANAGVDNSTMNFETAKNAIDYQIQQIVNSNSNKLAITFHGGGEALMEVKMLMKIVTYIEVVASKYELKPILGLVTNATLITKKVAVWLAKNFSHVTVSLDGTLEVQNAQRPYAGNVGSFNKVMSGIQNLVDENVNFSIRSTVTELSVNHLAKFVLFVKENIFPHGGNLDFEPVSLCGRARNNSNVVTTNTNVFLENYIHAKQVGKDLGINVTCSMDTFGSIKDFFCGASQAELQCFTPDNFLSACTRVTKLSDDGASLFFYGTVQNNQVNIDSSAKEKIKSLSNNFSIECFTCYARWNCQGGCSISHMNDKENFEQACYLTKTLLLHNIKSVINLYSTIPVVNKKVQRE